MENVKRLICVSVKFHFITLNTSIQLAGMRERERERERERDLSFVIVIMRFECTVKDDGGPWSLFGILLLYLWQG